MYNFYVLLM